MPLPNPIILKQFFDEYTEFRRNNKPFYLKLADYVYTFGSLVTGTEAPAQLKKDLIDTFKRRIDEDCKTPASMKKLILDLGREAEKSHPLLIAEVLEAIRINCLRSLNATSQELDKKEHKNDTAKPFIMYLNSEKEMVKEEIAKLQTNLDSAHAKGEYKDVSLYQEKIDKLKRDLVYLGDNSCLNDKNIVQGLFPNKKYSYPKDDAPDGRKMNPNYPRIAQLNFDAALLAQFYSVKSTPVNCKILSDEAIITLFEKDTLQRHEKAISALTKHNPPSPLAAVTSESKSDMETSLSTINPDPIPSGAKSPKILTTEESTTVRLLTPDTIPLDPITPPKKDSLTIATRFSPFSEKLEAKEKPHSPVDPLSFSTPNIFLSLRTDTPMQESGPSNPPVKIQSDNGLNKPRRRRRNHRRISEHAEQAKQSQSTDQNQYSPRR